LDFVKTENLFDLSRTIAAPLLEKSEYPWEILSDITAFITETAKNLDPAVYEDRGDGVYIARSAKIAPTAFIAGPCIICPDAEIRHCAYIRGSAIIGEGAVVGNSCEIKNAILFDKVQVPHFNYVGDSVLGYHAHMGAGAVTSNVKSDNSNVSVKFHDGGKIETGRRKFGAILGDNVEIGCNAVLCPGTVVGKNSTVYPLVRVRGAVEDDCIVKDAGNIAKKM